MDGTTRAPGKWRSATVVMARYRSVSVVDTAGVNPMIFSTRTAGSLITEWSSATKRVLVLVRQEAAVDLSRDFGRHHVDFAAAFEACDGARVSEKRVKERVIELECQEKARVLDVTLQYQ